MAHDHPVHRDGRRHRPHRVARPALGIPRRKEADAHARGPQAPLCPDDDPEFLFRLERDIQRKRREEERRERERRKRSDGDASDPTEASGDEAH